MNVVEYINYNLFDWLNNDEMGIMIGEDICDPYGGTFKATKGLSTEFPDKVFNMPISEALICGSLIGMGLEGVHPCGEIMFSDFLPIAYSQIFDNAEKLSQIYNQKLSYPFVLRTTVGGGFGYGPTHSQSIEKTMTHLSNVDVVAINNIEDDTYSNCFRFEGKPVLLFESKWLYTRKMIKASELEKRGFNTSVSKNKYKSHYFSIGSPGTDMVTIITYGEYFAKSIDIVYDFFINYEIPVGIIVLTNLSNIDYRFIDMHINKNNSILFVEGGCPKQGIGTKLFYDLYGRLNKFTILGAKGNIIPAAPELERDVIVTPEKIKSTLVKLVH